MVPYLDEARSLGHLFQLSCRAWGDKVALSVPEKKNRFTVSYREYYERVFAFAGAIAGLGLKRGDTICLYAENSYEWATLDWACQTLGVILVPVYPSLPADQVAYIVEDCGAKLFVAGNTELFERAKPALSLPMRLLRTGEDSIEALSQRHTLDRQAWEAQILEPNLDDVATLIYTSGTTGNPKGAILTHRAFVFLCQNIRASLPVDENDTFLSFLPLSHVYERFAGHVLPISMGASIGYVGSLATIASDFLAVRPTIMCCVPRFLDAFKDKIEDGVAKMPPLRQKMFHAARAAGLKRLRGEFSPFAGLLDKLVGEKVRARTGGRLRFFVSGGMAMPMHLYEFYGSLGMLVLQGYGLTETCAASAFNSPTDNHPDTVGRPIHGVEVKIAEDGEICLRGPSVMKGYHNLPEDTAAAIDADGWFHTGDIGTFKDQHLKITDRKKDLLVLANGKNVAPQPIENRLKESPYIAEAVLFGDSQTYVGGLIVPNLEKMEEHARSLGIKVDDPDRLLEQEPIRALVKQHVDAVNKKLADFEKVKKWDFIHAKFSVDTGELTPSLKVKRRVILERYRDQIAGLFRQ